MAVADSVNTDIAMVVVQGKAQVLDMNKTKLNIYSHFTICVSQIHICKKQYQMKQLHIEKLVVVVESRIFGNRYLINFYLP